MNDELLKLFGDVLDIDTNCLDMASTMDDIEEWDSLAHLRLVAAVEEEFSVRLDMEEIEAIDSVQAFKDAISRHSG